MEGSGVKTIGAKLEDRDFKECETVRRDLSLSRSDYVRKALIQFNAVHHFRALTDEGYPALMMGEPNADERTDTPADERTSIIDQVVGRTAESGRIGEFEGSDVTNEGGR